MKGNYDAVVALIESGSDVDGRIPFQKPNGFQGIFETPLDMAAKNLTYRDNPQNLELVKYLVAQGATRRVRGYHGDQHGGLECPVISGYLKSVSR